MSTWLQECPDCLYVGKDISAITPEESDAVREIGYIEAGLSENMPDLAIRFMRRAFIDNRIRRTRDAARRLLHAAWVLDDFELDAASVRSQAADLIEQLGVEAGMDLRLLRLDLLRRSRAFDDAKIEADRLLRLQLELTQRAAVVTQHRAALARRAEAIGFWEASVPRRRMRTLSFR